MKKQTNPKDVKKGYFILVILTAIIVSVIAVTCESGSDKPLTQKEVRDKKINNLLYENGSNAVNSKLITLVKNDLNDPNSMGNIEVSYKDLDSIIIVKQNSNSNFKSYSNFFKEMTGPKAMVDKKVKIVFVHS